MDSSSFHYRPTRSWQCIVLIGFCLICNIVSTAVLIALVSVLLEPKNNFGLWTDYLEDYEARLMGVEKGPNPFELIVFTFIITFKVTTGFIALHQKSSRLLFHHFVSMVLEMFTCLVFLLFRRAINPLIVLSSVSNLINLYPVYKLALYLEEEEIATDFNQGLPSWSIINPVHQYPSYSGPKL